MFYRLTFDGAVGKYFEEVGLSSGEAMKIWPVGATKGWINHFKPRGFKPKDAALAAVGYEIVGAVESGLLSYRSGHAYIEVFLEIGRIGFRNGELDIAASQQLSTAMKELEKSSSDADDIRAKTAAPIPEYSHAPPAATSPPDDLVQQISDSAPDQSQSSVLFCSECGQENPAEVNFCTKCRAKMTLECNKCGFKSPQGSEFCGSCGEDTEFRVEKRARNAALAAEAATAAAAAAARVRETAAAARVEAAAAAEAWARLIPVERYFDNGQLQVQGGQKEGKWHGPYARYHENGQLQERSTYNAGEFDGPYEMYYENGQLQGKGTYAAGELHGPAEAYYENGQLREASTYKAGELDGSFEFYHENGQLQQKSTFVAGERDGPFESYYENGQLRRRGTWNMGEACGEWSYEGGPPSRGTRPPCPPGPEDGN